MKVLELIKELQEVKEKHGNIEVQLQDDGKTHPLGIIKSFPDFFVIPEEYEDGWFCNIRWWPY